jgi:hypothetical protein
VWEIRRLREELRQPIVNDVTDAATPPAPAELCVCANIDCGGFYCRGGEC